MSMSMTFVAAGWLAADVPNPGTGDAPPAVVAGLNKGLGLLAQIGVYSCVAGVLITAIVMGVLYRRGEITDHFGRLGVVLGACVLIGGASGFVTFFI